MFKNLLLILLFTGIVGCAFKPDPIPRYAGPLNVYPSPNNISIVTEMPSSDHLVTDSQVFIAGGNQLSNVLFFLMGPIGTLTGLAIDQTVRSDDKLSNNETLSIKFDELLKEILQKENEKLSKINIVESKNIADLIMLPSARLIDIGDSQFRVEFRLAVRYKNPISKSTDTRDYWFLDDTKLPIVGIDSWSEKQAKSLKLKAELGIKYLVKLVLLDIEGRYEVKNSIGEIRRLKTPFMKQAEKIILLDGLDDFAVIAETYQGKRIESSKNIVAKKYVLK